MKEGTIVNFTVKSQSRLRFLVMARGLGVQWTGQSSTEFIHGGLIGKEESATGWFYLEPGEEAQIAVQLSGIGCNPCKIFPSTQIPRKLNPDLADEGDWKWVPGESVQVTIQ